MEVLPQAVTGKQHWYLAGQIVPGDGGGVASAGGESGTTLQLQQLQHQNYQIFFADCLEIHYEFRLGSTHVWKDTSIVSIVWTR